jgi:hypothetical protein
MTHARQSAAIQTLRMRFPPHVYRRLQWPRMGGRRNYLLLAVSVLFVCGGAFLLATARTAQDLRLALAVTAFFGGCLLVALAQALFGGDGLIVTRTGARTAFRAAPGRPLMMGLAGALWLGAGVAGLATDMGPLRAWALILFGGAVALVLLGVALDRRIKIAVDDQGLADYRVLRTPIPWAAIARIEGRGARLAVSLHDPGAFSGLRRRGFALFQPKLDPLVIKPIAPSLDLAAIAAAIEAAAPPGFFAAPEGADEDEAW